MKRTLLMGAMAFSLCGSAFAVEFVPLGVGAWETSGNYTERNYQSSFVYPLGQTTEDSFYTLGWPEDFGEWDPELYPRYWKDYLPDYYSLPSPTTPWDSGLAKVFISDDGLTIAGSGNVNNGMSWYRFDPDGGATSRLVNRVAFQVGYIGELVALSADGLTGAVTRPGPVSSAVHFGWNTMVGEPEYIQYDNVPPGLDTYWHVESLCAISGDGEVLAGVSRDGVAFRWSEEYGGFQIVDGLEAVSDVSHDGSVIVGDAMWWNEADGARYFGPEPTAEFEYEAVAVSADGSVIAGTAKIDGVPQAFRWTEADGFQLLGDLPGGSERSYVTEMSSDGTTIVGMSSTDRGYEPFRWNSLTEMESVVDLLIDGGVDVGDYQLISPTMPEFREISGTKLYYATVTGVSGDGSVLVGSATFPGSNTRQAWLARIAIVPEPSAALLLVVASGLLALHVRRAATV